MSASSRGLFALLLQLQLAKPASSNSSFWLGLCFCFCLSASGQSVCKVSKNLALALSPAKSPTFCAPLRAPKPTGGATRPPPPSARVSQLQVRRDFESCAIKLAPPAQIVCRCHFRRDRQSARWRRPGCLAPQARNHIAARPAPLLSRDRTSRARASWAIYLLVSDRRRPRLEP